MIFVHYLPNKPIFCTTCQIFVIPYILVCCVVLTSQTKTSYFSYKYIQTSRVFETFFRTTQQTKIQSIRTKFGDVVQKTRWFRKKYTISISIFQLILLVQLYGCGKPEYIVSTLDIAWNTYQVKIIWFSNEDAFNYVLN